MLQLDINFEPFYKPRTKNDVFEVELSKKKNFKIYFNNYSNFLFYSIINIVLYK